MAKNTQDTFAVIMTGGKQYKVAAGDVITVEKLNGEYKEGDKVVFDQVLLTDSGSDTKLGSPTVAGAKVEGTFKGNGRHAKVTVIHYKQKSRYFKKNGHRQPFSKVEITKI
jgi:large subunit ribosomal protein L21